MRTDIDHLRLFVRGDGPPNGQLVQTPASVEERHDGPVTAGLKQRRHGGNMVSRSGGLHGQGDTADPSRRGVLKKDRRQEDDNVEVGGRTGG